jgi:four helix bundle suffix protein
MKEWERSDPRKDDLVARRLTTADYVAAWVVEKCGGGCGLIGRLGLGGKMQPTLSKSSNQSKGSTPPPSHAEAAANAALVLINVATALLGRQVNSLALAFETQGGFTERLYATRRQTRTG